VFNMLPAVKFHARRAGWLLWVAGLPVQGQLLHWDVLQDLGSLQIMQPFVVNCKQQTYLQHEHQHAILNGLQS
jgi:hypothetical protein